VLEQPVRELQLNDPPNLSKSPRMRDFDRFESSLEWGIQGAGKSGSILCKEAPSGSEKRLNVRVYYTQAHDAAFIKSQTINVEGGNNFIYYRRKL
jgi:hypothetical protein